MMKNAKRNYETPTAEKMMFNYHDQVVAASPGGTGDKCVDVWVNTGYSYCEDGSEHYEHIG